MHDFNCDCDKCVKEELLWKEMRQEASTRAYDEALDMVIASSGGYRLFEEEDDFDAIFEGQQETVDVQENILDTLELRLKLETVVGMAAGFTWLIQEPLQDLMQGRPAFCAVTTELGGMIVYQVIQHGFFKTLEARMDRVLIPE